MKVGEVAGFAVSKGDSPFQGRVQIAGKPRWGPPRPTDSLEARVPTRGELGLGDLPGQAQNEVKKDHCKPLAGRRGRRLTPLPETALVRNCTGPAAPPKATALTGCSFEDPLTGLSDTRITALSSELCLNVFCLK